MASLFALTLPLAVLGSVQTPGFPASPAALVFESSEMYLKALAAGPAGSRLELIPCGAGRDCTEASEAVRERVVAVVGQPRNASRLSPDVLPNLQLLQATHYMHTQLSDVPAHIAVAAFLPDWQRDYGAEPIAEFVIAAMFEWNYRLSRQAAAFAACAFAPDAPKGCPPTSALTAHRVLSGMTLGVLGYGTIGRAVASRAAALGMRVVATKAHGPFEPTPRPLAWLGGDNDRLLRESDFVAVTAPGSLRGLVNSSALMLMKPGAVLIPVSAPPVNFDDLLSALRQRRIGGAVLDVWPNGCWHFPDQACGPPYGPLAWPYKHRELVDLDNVVVLPGSSMRDDKFWSNSAAFVGANLEALLDGKPLRGIVRAASPGPGGDLVL